MINFEINFKVKLEILVFLFLFYFFENEILATELNSSSSAKDVETKKAKQSYVIGIPSLDTSIEKETKPNILKYVPGKPFQASLEFKEKLAPEQYNLRAGSKFKEENLPRIEFNDLWFWIPEWLAGSFRIDSQYMLFVYDYKFHRLEETDAMRASKANDYWGAQKDKTGAIWAYKNYPETGHLEHAMDYTIERVNFFEPLEISKDRVVMHYFSTELQVSSLTNIIQKSTRVEAIQEYTPYAADKIRVYGSLKSFDDQGNPALLERTLMIETKESGFKAINFLNGNDLRKSFRDFLVSHGQQELVPDSYRKIFADE